MQAAIGAPATAGGGDQRLTPFALETQAQLFRRQLLEHALDRRAAGGEQRHLVRLQVAEAAADGLLGGKRAGFAAA